MGPIVVMVAIVALLLSSVLMMYIAEAKSKADVSLGLGHGLASSIS